MGAEPTLGAVLADRSLAYVLTIGADGRPHVATSSAVALADGVLVVPFPGKTTSSNATARPDVTLVWPPADPAGYSLIVDGTAAVGADRLELTLGRTVLHRSGPGDGSGPCGSDCIPVRA